MYILHNGYPVEATDLHDETLADFDEQVLSWLRELLTRHPHTSGTQM